MSNAVAYLQSLGLVAAGSLMTVLAQKLTERRAKKAAEREGHERQVLDALSELRSEIQANKEATAELRGFIQGKEAV